MAYLNFSWILEGALAGSQGPASQRDLMFLKLQEIKAVIRMETGTISGEGLDLADMFEPVEDGQPPTMEQIGRMTHFIEAQIETWEHPVVVTCYAGLGRTGTVLACYMVYVGYTPTAAIEHIRAHRPGSIQTAVQEAAVHEYSAILKDEERERRRKAIEALGDV